MPSARTASAADVVTRYPELEVSSIESSGLNPRTHWNDADDRELEESIRAEGVLEPIIVRPHPSKGNVYQIVAGERRFRAAGAVGLGQMPAIVREVTDEKLLELALTENIQRRSMHPLDEANGFIKRLEMGGTTPEALANSLGLGKRYVTDRIRLKKLSPKAAKMLEAGEMTVSHAIVLAKLDPKLQNEAIESCQEGQFDYERGGWEQKLNPVDDIKRWIADNVPIDVTSAEAQEEFPQLVEASVEAAAKGATIVTLSTNRAPWQHKAKPTDPLFADKWQECKKSDKAAQIGVVVEGRRRGERVYWKPVAERAKTHAASESKRELSPAEKKVRDRELAEQRRQREQQQAWNTLKPKAKVAFKAHIDKLPLKQVFAILERKNGALEHDGTPEGFLRAYAAKQHVYCDHNVYAFGYGTKGTGFDVKKWFKAEAAALKKASPAKAAKKTKKR